MTNCRLRAVALAFLVTCALLLVTAGCGGRERRSDDDVRRRAREAHDRRQAEEAVR